MALASTLPVVANRPVNRAFGPRTLRPTLSVVRNDDIVHQYLRLRALDALCRCAYRRDTAPDESIAGPTSSPPGGRLSLLLFGDQSYDGVDGAHIRCLWRARGLMRLDRSFEHRLED